LDASQKEKQREGRHRNITQFDQIRILKIIVYTKNSRCLSKTGSSLRSEKRMGYSNRTRTYGVKIGPFKKNPLWEYSNTGIFVKGLSCHWISKKFFPVNNYKHVDFNTLRSYYYVCLMRGWIYMGH
jgi:hypothetical protein